MSMFSMPDGLAPGANAMDEMMKAMTDMMKLDGTALPGPAAFMAMPLLGFGMAAQMWGSWLGSMQGLAAGASCMPNMDKPLKAPLMFWSDADEDSRAFTASAMTPLGFVAAATKTMVADFEHAAQDMVVVGEHVAADFAGEAGEVVRLFETAQEAAIGAAGLDTVESFASADDEIMPEDFVQPKRIDKPAEPDDLKMISGIGRKIEKKLNELGVWSWAQVAGWTANEVAWVDDFLSFKGRIGREDWIAQARALARGGRDEYVKVFGKEPR